MLVHERGRDQRLSTKRSLSAFQHSGIAAVPCKTAQKCNVIYMFHIRTMIFETLEFSQILPREK